MKWINAKLGFDPTAWRRGFELFGQLWCLERSTIFIEGQRYMTRYIVYAFGGTLRLHKFYRGDDDRAPHTHPWNFWTFPLAGYRERQFYHGAYMGTYPVRPWQWHRRTCFHEHIVTERMDGSKKPFWTVVITGPRINEWGFYVKDNSRQLLSEPGTFIHWRDRP